MRGQPLCVCLCQVAGQAFPDLMRPQNLKWDAGGLFGRNTISTYFHRIKVPFLASVHVLMVPTVCRQSACCAPTLSLPAVRRAPAVCTKLGLKAFARRVNLGAGWMGVGVGVVVGVVVGLLGGVSGSRLSTNRVGGAQESSSLCASPVEKSLLLVGASLPPAR